MNDFYELLQKIKKRPAMYLGRHSIFSLQAFLDGYYYARREASIPLTEQEQEFQQFLQWIRVRFKVETGQPWASIILFHTADEKDAVERFFNLFEEFLKQKSNSNTDWLVAQTPA
ncbi:MAG: hypothetical protein HC866_11350 [Leptolyngbyaceae cyanobacterium RU_5_1]|nr:hypothetical protein [Leptolyngbyaceae cyanobacterium RU_5_1]